MKRRVLLLVLAACGSNPSTPAKTYVVKLRRNMDAYTCSASEGTATATTTKNLVIGNSPWVSGLVAANATVRFHWFMVVESY